MRWAAEPSGPAGLGWASHGESFILRLSAGDIQLKDMRRFFAASMFVSMMFISTIPLLWMRANAQPSYAPSNNLPNPYTTVTGWTQLPEGRKWGSTAGVYPAPDGHIWAYD